MQRESWKVFLACAIGAGLGSLVALEMHQYFWWVGLIVGGLTGYLSYEWRAVLRAIPQAYRAARGYQFPVDFWPMFFWSTIAMWSVAMDVVTGFMLFFAAIDSGLGFRVITTSFFYGMAGMVTCAALVIPLLGFFLANAEDRGGAAWRDAAGARRVLRIAFPPILFGWHFPRLILRIVMELTRGLYTAAMAVPQFTHFLRRFGWELFLRIHSEMRLLCGVDAMLGAAVGYFAGSVLIGAAAGGLFGGLNYAVVTERWLKRRGYLPIRS